MTIRKQPEDFVVRERLADGVAVDRRAPFAVLELTKRSLTTEHACALLARAMGVRAGHVAHAGLKDKHAVTIQHVSVPTDHASVEGSWSGAGWSARVVGWSDAPLTSRAIACNEFEIVVRDLSRESVRRMDDRARDLVDGDVLTFVNFFGSQRFGSARHGEGFAGAALVRGDFETALKLLIATPHRKDMGVKRAFTRALASGWGEWARLAKELPRCPDRRAIEALASGGTFRHAFEALPYSLQEMAIDSYQSLVWNRAAQILVRRRVDALQCVHAEDDFGGMSFPKHRAMPPDLLVLDAPLPSPELTHARPWAEAVREVLREDGLTLDQLHVPGLRRPRFSQSSRTLCARASRFTMSAARRDELSSQATRLARTLRFALPSASYATVVLRALGE